MPLRTLLLLPVCAHKRVVALIGLGNSVNGYSEKDAERLGILISQAAITLEHARMRTERNRLQAEVASLAGQLMRAQEEERKRLSRELHDGLGQDMTAALISLQCAKAETPSKAGKAHLDQAGSLIRRAMDDVRQMSQNLRPALLDDFGLITALQREAKGFGRLSGLEVSLRLPRQSDLHLGTAEETALFRIAQESLTNVAKHAKATRVVVTLRCAAKEVCMTVSDNGRGFSVEEARRKTEGPQLGHQSIRERVKLLGGRADLTSKIGRGTKISVRIPRRDA